MRLRLRWRQPRASTRGQAWRPNARRAARLAANGGHHSPREWATLKAWFGNRCLACGSLRDIQCDHVVPVARGGTDWVANLQPLCRACNLRKGIRTIDYRDRHSLHNYLVWAAKQGILTPVPASKTASSATKK